MIDFSTLLGLAIGMSSSNRSAIEKASAENTAAIAELRRDIVRLSGGTPEPAPAPAPVALPPAKPVEPVPTGQSICAAIGFVLIIAIVVIASNDKMLRWFL